MITFRYFCWFCNLEYAHEIGKGHGKHISREGLCWECFAALEEHYAKRDVNG
jgi:predicted amidophosphoribosyltransferase